VDDLDREKNAAEAKRHELAQAMLDLTSQKDALTEELVAMNAAEAAHEKRIADLEAALKGKEDEAARAGHALASEVDEVKSEMDGLRARMAAEIAARDTFIASLKVAKEAKQKELAALQIKEIDMKFQLEESSEKLRDVEQQMEVEVASREKRDVEQQMEVEVASRERYIQYLSRNKEEKRAALVELRSTNGDLQSALRKCEDQLAEAQAETAALRADKDKLEEEVARLGAAGAKRDKDAVALRVEVQQWRGLQATLASANIIIGGTSLPPTSPSALFSTITAPSPTPLTVAVDPSKVVTNLLVFPPVID